MQGVFEKLTQGGLGLLGLFLGAGQLCCVGLLFLFSAPDHAAAQSLAAWSYDEEKDSLTLRTECTFDV